MKVKIDVPITADFEVPVLIIGFNRPRYINEQLHCIRSVKPKNLYIACDGPRQIPGELERVDAVRAGFLNGIDWECNVRTRFSPVNQGCCLGVINALKWFFSHERHGIILEDDIMPSVDFFRFSSAMLNHYQHDNRVFSVSGCNLGYNTAPSSVFFSKIMNMWGWATWADRFERVDFEMAEWNRIHFKQLFLLRRLALSPFDIDPGWAGFWRQIFDKQVGPEMCNTWDYQLIFNQIHSRQLTVFPGVNLVRNVGFDSDATHTEHDNHFMIGLDPGQIEWPLSLDSSAIKPDLIFNELYIKERWSFYKRTNWKFHLGRFLRMLIPSRGNK
jgi:hypothetical protein